MTFINKLTPVRIFPLMLCLLAGMMGCRKTEYNVIPDAAYLRVFNSFNYTVDITNKDFPPPFLAMVIDPEYDAAGNITGGKVLGDFLDKRSPYAPPYPDKAGNTSYKNTEYPGSAKVLAGPVLNGIDLSSWAQVASGKHRVVFYARPVTPERFFDLRIEDRQYKLVDSLIDLTPGSVYTMQVLQKNVASIGSLSAQLYLREEQFTRQSFSDSMLYVNFYNLSANGYAALNPEKPTYLPSSYYFPSNKAGAVQDEMNVYYTLFTKDAPYPYVQDAPMGTDIVDGFNNVYLGKLIRSFSPKANPYYAIPMFAGNTDNDRIISRQWELFTLLSPNRTPIAGPIAIDAVYGMATDSPDYAAIGCGTLGNDGKDVGYAVASLPIIGFGHFVASFWLPNLIKYTASGDHAQQSFATISTIEVINNQVYMMSVQRRYPYPNN